MQSQEQKLESSRVVNGQKELDGCSFKPVINRNSERAASISKRRDGRDVSTRLYDERMMLDSKRQSRLKEKEVEEEKKYKEEHSFKPALSTKKVNSVNRRAGTPVESRYRRVGASPCQRRSTDKDEECTFTPAVKGVTKNMSSAAAYLKTGVFERLDRGGKENGEGERVVYEASEVNDPNVNGGGGSEQGERSVMDMATFMDGVQNTNTQQSGGSARKRPSSAKKARGTPRASSAQKARPGSARPGSAQPGSAQKAQFHEFLARQNHTELKKVQKIEGLAAQQVNTHRPKLCEGSKAMTADRKGEDFLKRMKQYQIRKDHQFIRLKAQYEKDPEVKEGPELTEKSRQLAEGGRTVVELSNGDARKRESNLRLLKVKLEKEESMKYREVPEINESSRPTASKLGLHNDPDNYLDRLQREQKKKKSLIRIRQQELEMKELSDCTFAPQTSECPGYIKRIARSMALTKTMQAPGGSVLGEAEKPEWR